jgi:hypothetical protein
MPLPISLPNPFAGDDEVTAEMMNALANVLNALATAPSSEIEVYRGTMFHDESIVIEGDAIEITMTSVSSVDVVYASQSPAAIDDEFLNGLYLSADTYTLKVDAWVTNSSGIVSWYVDDVLEGTTDLYSASAGHDEKTVATIVIATSGWHVIRGVVASKNGSSSGYSANIFKMSMAGSLA